MIKRIGLSVFLFLFAVGSCYSEGNDLLRFCRSEEAIHQWANNKFKNKCKFINYKIGDHQVLIVVNTNESAGFPSSEIYVYQIGNGWFGLLLVKFVDIRPVFVVDQKLNTLTILSDSKQKVLVMPEDGLEGNPQGWTNED